MKILMYKCEKCEELFSYNNVHIIPFEDNDEESNEYHLCFDCSKKYILQDIDKFRDWADIPY